MVCCAAMRRSPRRVAAPGRVALGIRNTGTQRARAARASDSWRSRESADGPLLPIRSLVRLVLELRSGARLVLRGGRTVDGVPAETAAHVVELHGHRLYQGERE